RTDGALDISIGPASSLWRFDPESPRIPPPSSLISAVSHIDYRQIAVEGTTVRLPQGAMLDLGAIAKGYIADRLKEFLLAEGVESALINLGGNLLCVGQKPGGVPFRVGVQLPFSAYGQTAVTLLVSDRSAVTSGIYERCFEQDGKLYHHILDPKTGFPCESDLASVTVLSASSMDGDALSTACLLLGLERGKALIDSLPDVQAVLIDRDGGLHYSQGFERAVKIA
ncbi:MAG: FAD:protein FMN transferase, partial [Oscillospiraceae bacterium]